MMGLGVIALVTVGIACLCLFLATASVRVLVVTSAAVGMGQFYLTSVDSFPLGLVFGALLFLFEAGRVAGTRLGPTLRLLSALLLLSLVASLWSVDAIAWAAGTVRLMALLGFALLFVRAIAAGERSLYLFALVTGLGLAVESVMVVIFRVLPAVENRYLHSGIAGLLAGRGRTINLFAGSPDNVLDPSKAGGVMLNANSASMLLGGGAMLLMAAGLRTRSRGLLVLGALSYFGSLVTGSKSALVLAVLVPVIVSILLLPAALKMFSGLAFLVAMFALVVSGKWVDLFSGSTRTDAVNTIDTRLLIYRAADQFFHESPVRGLGYGGWAFRFGEVARASGLEPRFPPHNSVILAWSETGIFGVILMVCLLGTVAVKANRKVGSAQSFSLAVSTSLIFGCVCWVFLHSLADVTPFYGDVRTIAMVAFCFALLEESRSSGAENSVAAKNLERLVVPA